MVRIIFSKNPYKDKEKPPWNIFTNTQMGKGNEKEAIFNREIYTLNKGC